MQYLRRCCRSLKAWSKRKYSSLRLNQSFTVLETFRRVRDVFLFLYTFPYKDKVCINYLFF